MAIIKSCGSDLATMIARFGEPSDVVPSRGDKEDMDSVLCDYDTFMFSFRDQKIRGALFRKTWKGLIMGIKIGDFTRRSRGEASSAPHRILTKTTTAVSISPITPTP